MAVGVRVRVLGCAVAVFAAALIAYVYRLCPVVGGSDLGEFVVMPGFLAPGHYPGYPFLNQVLYLPHLVAVNPAYFAGFLNAVFAAAAVAVLWASWRVICVRPAVGVPLALAFALTPAYWGTAAAGAEAFGLEALAAAVLLYLLFEGIIKKDPRYFLVAVFVFTLSLGNRVSFALFAPLLAAVFILTGKRGAAAATCVFLLGISVYIHFVLRNDYFGDQYGQTRLITWGRVYNELFKIWRYDFFTTGFGEAKSLSKDVLGGLIFQMKYGLLLLVPAGVAAFIVQGRKWGLIAGALAVTTAGFLWAYVAYPYASDEPYLIIPLVLFFTFAAQGAEWITKAITGRWWGARVIVPLVLFIMPLYYLVKNCEAVDHTNDVSFDCLARETYKIMPYEAAVLAEHHVLMPVVYYRSVLDYRQDVGLYSVTLDSWEEAPARLWAGDLYHFDEIGSNRPRWTPERAAYFINEWPSIDFRPGLRRESVPGEFLARAITSLPPGGRFCAVIGDAVPFTVARRVNIWGWQTYYWRQTGTDFPLERRTGTCVFLAGRRKKNGVGVYAAAKWGACAGGFVCPDKLAPPPTSVIGFGCDGDAPYGLDGLHVEIGEDVYSIRSSGIIFVPLTSDWRAADGPLYYSHHGLGPFYIFEILRPWDSDEGK